MKTLLNWQAECSPLPPNWRHLVCAPSLTKALQSLPAEFSVKLRRLGTDAAGIWFAPGLPETGRVWIRDVDLCLDGVSVVQARSACAEGSHWQEILNCGTTPLGQILFGGTLALERSPLEFCRSESWPCLRRSRFVLAGETLDLVECFLPELERFLPQTA